MAQLGSLALTLAPGQSRIFVGYRRWKRVGVHRRNDRNWSREDRRRIYGCSARGDVVAFAKLAVGVEQGSGRALELDHAVRRALVEAAAVRGFCQQRGHRTVDAGRVGVQDLRGHRVDRGVLEVYGELAGLAADRVRRVAGLQDRVEPGVLGAGELDGTTWATHEELGAVLRVGKEGSVAVVAADLSS